LVAFVVIVKVESIPILRLALDDLQVSFAVRHRCTIKRRNVISTNEAIITFGSDSDAAFRFRLAALGLGFDAVCDDPSALQQAAFN
jgi:hypothetical protein